jgi:flagellar biosynthesis/type III secretory pathway chaperone
MIDLNIGVEARNIVTDAILACETIEHFLKEENKVLKGGHISIIEENLKNKQRLAAKVERLLKLLQTQPQEVKNNPDLKPQIEHLKSAFESYQNEARHNSILLQGAHYSTTNVLGVLRDAVQQHQQKNEAKTYAKDGSVQSTGTGKRLVMKEV